MLSCTLDQAEVFVPTSGKKKETTVVTFEDRRVERETRLRMGPPQPQTNMHGREES